MPDRIQLKRTKGWRMPPNTVKVSRPGPWGNPYRIGDTVPGIGKVYGAADAVAFYRRYVIAPPPGRQWSDLRGKNLACWCKPGEPCHADVLLSLANG
jgi:hypothetical protein